MIWAFALYTLLLIPTFFFYGGGSGYGDADVSKLGYAPKTIGALGYSSYACSSIPVQITSQQFTLSCEYGLIGEITYYGVNPDTSRGNC